MTRTKILAFFVSTLFFAPKLRADTTTFSSENDVCAPSEGDQNKLAALLAKDDLTFPESFYYDVKRDVFDVYKMMSGTTQTHHDCDDGYYAEAWNGLVEDIFVKHPKQISLLILLMKRDSAFHQFILRHLSEDMNAAETPKALINTKTACPPDQKELCNAIVDRIQNPGGKVMRWEDLVSKSK